MSTQLIPLSSLTAQMTPADQVFYADVIKRDRNADGSDKGILRRIQASEQCQACIQAYRAKHKEKPFSIKCEGVYDTPDYEAFRENLGSDGDDMPLEEIREIYDSSFWASRHMVVKNEEGDIVPLVMRWFQEESLRCTSPRKVDRWGRGMGKRIRIDTPIPTPAGWTTMGDLKVGDFVFDEQGQPVRVTNVSPILMATDTYDVVFSDGSVIHADADHLWETWTHAARKAESRKDRRTGKLAHTRPVPVPEVRTTEEIKQTLLHGTGNRVEHNHSVVLCQPLQYSEKVQSLHPYVFGYWLGDGSSGSHNITTADSEVLEMIRGFGYEVDFRERYTWSVSIPGTQHTRRSFASHLKRLEVLKNYREGASAVPKHSKFIPECYLHGSVEQRMQLLKGLMDSDGTCCKTQGHCSFCGTNERLVNDVYELVAGLGFKPTLAKKTKRSQHGTEVDAWEVKFTPHKVVFGLTRKAERQRINVRSTQFHRYIVEVRKAEPALMRCISVDSERHLYLAGRSCIPTHNSLAGVAEELHFICNNKNTYTIVVCPSQAQAQMWWDEILFQIENSPSFAGKDFLLQKKQQPYYYMRFGNGGVIAIFTAGSKSGKGADSIRGQSPRRIRLDEQDYLADKDYQAIMPLLRRFKRSTFHGSSTPSGLRGMYWQMCNRLPEFREFYHPITDHPNWNTDQLNYESCFTEAKTLDRYRHEWLAEFGDPSAGVFKSKFVDDATQPYEHRRCVHSPEKRYFMGVDWNGKGTGTRICVIEYNPETRTRRVVARAVVDDPAATTKMSIAKIIDLNRSWHCEEIYVDAGFGFVQDELMRDLGARNAHDPDVAKLKHIKVIDFGAKLKTNRIVPNRDEDSKYLPTPKEEELERRTKPFLVEGAVMCFEGGLVEFSGTDDKLLEEQIRGYRVKTWTKGGQADTYETDAESGDHDLDAMLLALLGVELKYGLWHGKETAQRLARIAHVSGWGLPATIAANPMVTAQIREAAQMKVEPDTIQQLARQEAGIPSRTRGQRVAESLQEQYRLSYLSRGAMVISPAGNAASLRGGGRIPSRTGVFQQGASQRQIHQGSGRRFH